MATLEQDTIVAVATAAGQGGVGIVRLSGVDALKIAEKITKKKLKPRLATYTAFYLQNNELLDNGIGIYFPSPNSFTGESVVELQAHGSPVVLDHLIEVTLLYGARQARPGEFTERAFLNNKMDLTQAEAIADLISASSRLAARAAINTMQGKFSAEVNFLIEKIIALRVYIEAAMDFPEEEVSFLTDGKIADRLSEINNQLNKIAHTSKQGTMLAEGQRIVIAGRPNAGKSSLLNALAGRDAAIVTAIPGTTRDVLHEDIQIDGLPLRIIDTAGLRESTEPIEREGIRRAALEIEKADHVLFVIDSSDSSEDALWPKELSALAQKHTPLTVIKNKCDLSGLAPSVSESTITISLETGAGLDLLKEHLKEALGFGGDASGIFSARRRHLNALTKTQEHVEHCLKQLLAENNSELLAEELRLAQIELEAITGKFTPEDLLDKIFRDFCIGK